MHLKSLEINGYKSFAKKGVLTFNTPISAIVGPNGSGKSNVAEAFRFALGEQSLKNMRGKKGEDMIFSGGDTAGKLNKAAVTITFDNQDRLLPIDFDEITIERTVHRDGSNDYKINGSQVRLKDVIELLASANIGATGHHIISQGEADRILNASPKDRRSMLEDALGLKVFQYKKTESERKLIKTEENIGQVQSLRKEIAPHIRFLKKQVEKVEKGKEMQAELKVLYQYYLKREDMYLKQKAEDIKTAKEEPTKRLATLKEERAQLEAEINSQEENSKDIHELNRLQDEVNELNQKKNDLLRNAGSLEGQIKSIERLKERDDKKNEAADTKVLPLKEIVELKEDIDSADTTDALGLIARIKETLKVLIERYQEKKVDETNDLAEELRELYERKKTVDAELAQVTTQLEEATRRLQDLQQSIDAQKEGVLEAEKKILEVMQELNTVQTTLQKIQTEETTFLRDKEEYERELHEAVTLAGHDAIRFDDVEIKEGERIISDDEILTEDRDKQISRRKDLERLKIRVEDMGAQGGDDVLKEYQDITEREAFLIKEIEDLEKSAASLKEMIVELDQKINSKFKSGITHINTEFQKFFELMFGGGNASLRLVKQETRRKKRDTDIPLDDSDEVPDEEDDEDTEEGVEISVNLPRKKVKGLMMLSGGERALTSIALLFAMSSVNPPPFIILDETDAALDEANSRKYGDMIVNLSKHSQLILITHNRETMSRAGVLYGITMQQGMSQVLSIAFDEGLEYAK